MSSVCTGPIIGSPITQDNASSVPALGAGSSTESSLLPPGFPTKLTSELAWVGSDFRADPSYIYRLSELDLAEIRTAIAYFKSLELDGEHVSRNTFPLPNLGATLDELSQSVHNGRGFCLVRGIDPKKYTVEDVTLIYLGIQTYIADQRGRQDNRGNMLVHIVADNSTKTSSEHHRHSSKSIAFHNEETGDVVSWLTRSTATSGGRCILASVHTVYNILAARRPDILRQLARSDWPFALPHFQCRPVLFYHGSKIMMNFGRAALLGSKIHPRPKNLPSISSRQLEALNAIEVIAKATQLEIPTEAGDMHFINNLAILHRREEFRNGATTTEKRHLVRMRLRSTQLGWNLPRELADDWKNVFDTKARRVWHLEPMPEAFFPLRKYPN